MCLDLAVNFSFLKVLLLALTPVLVLGFLFLFLVCPNSGQSSFKEVARLMF